MKVVSSVMPLRLNRYVMDSLIDWDDVPRNPVYQINFPQRGMLDDADFARVADLMKRDAG